MHLLHIILSTLGLAAYVASHSRGERTSLPEPPDLSDLRHEGSIFHPRPLPKISSGVRANVRPKVSPGHKFALTVGPRCGPRLGHCDDGLCCSPLGYCGKTIDHCRSPDCQIDYGVCDASRTPEGRPTTYIARPHIGNVPYGRHGIFICTVPKTVALTFDDGPNRYTSDLLNVLDSYRAKATFFVSGVNSGKGQIDDFTLPWGPLIQRMHRSGHQIGSHTWSHEDLSKISRSQRRDQMFKNEAAIRNILGGIPTYMRPPYSSCTIDSGCLDDMDDLGYHVTYFNIDTDDYNNDHPHYIQRSKDIFDRAIDMQDPPGRSFLVVAHDVHEQTAHNLTAHILKKTYAKGYRAVTVGECLGDSRDHWYRWDYSTPVPKLHD